VGILGLSHDHVWGNVAALAAGGRAGACGRLRTPILGCASACTGSTACGAPRQSRGLLERRDLDAVLLFDDNRASAALGVRALGRGLPVMIEKPMAADLAGADALLVAARRAPACPSW
jgi:predicted dehydrogenase